MLLPRSADLTFVPPDDVEGARQAPLAQAIVLGKLDLWLQPKLRFPVRVMDVYM
jgi:hypothetical protein